MPEMNGYDAYDSIRDFLNEKGMQQPMIIATTGHTEDEYIKKCWVHQINEVLSKPISVSIDKQVLHDIFLYFEE